MKTFKSKIIHQIEWYNKEPYYYCNRAVGKLSGQQIIFKTNQVQGKVTCKNCLKWKKKEKQNNEN